MQMKYHEPVFVICVAPEIDDALVLHALPEAHMLELNDAGTISAEQLAVLEQRAQAGHSTIIAGSATEFASVRHEIKELTHRYYLQRGIILIEPYPELMRAVKYEGFKDQFFVLHNRNKLTTLKWCFEPAPCDKRQLSGPFDIIGDVHGCFTELWELLQRLGYRGSSAEPWILRHPENRTLIFVGDLVDRGPRTPDVLKLVRTLVEAGRAYTVLGNHDDRLQRALSLHNVKVQHGLAESLAQLGEWSEEEQHDLRDWIRTWPVHIVLDAGKLVVAHAGLPAKMHCRVGERVKARALYGKTAKKTGPDGLPIRLNWQAHYHDEAFVVYGHTPVLEAVQVNQTLNIDTGCVFGGALTALRYPEHELVSVTAQQTYTYSPRWPPLDETA